MSTRVVDQVDSWGEQSFSGGYRELHELADSEFSGVVRAGGAELYMTRGVAVGLRLGDIDDLESAGTVYKAPADALPLLAIMQERNDEVRAKYYTEDTSISKVDRTLSDGGFTGFIELTENVLSGDYYIVYQAGKSMSVAYVGEASRLLDGDEAFEMADDEVGIYEVRPAKIEPIEIPEPEEKPEEAAGSGATDTDDADDNADSLEPQAEPPDVDTTPAQAETTSTDETNPSTATAGEESPATTAESNSSATATEASEAAESPPGATTVADGTAADNEHSEEAATTTGAEGQQSQNPPEQPESTAPATQNTRSQQHHDQSPQQPLRETASEPGQRPDRETPRQGQSSGRQTTASSQDLETKAIPSLDPVKTDIPDQPGDSSSSRPQAETERAQGHAGAQPARESRTSQSARNRVSEPSQGTHAQGETDRQQFTESQQEVHADGTMAPDATQDQGADATEQNERIDELESELEQKEAEIERLKHEVESATSERDELAAEREELEAEVKRLESDLEQLEEELGATTDAERRITANEALSGTDIFVRYSSKGKPTLEKAHGSSTRKDEVNENLRLEKHTQFDASSVAVSGQSYHEFLESTLEYQFVRWIVRELLFEIRDTGHERELTDLYEVLAQIDRAELAGVVDVTYTEDGQETQRQESFDVVLRDRMGHPLLTANLNDTRQATTEDMMERLVTAAERVGQSSKRFAGAFLVTESFFDPGALEVASSATQGGLLSRDKRKSFVNLSRKSGYHLCLVEARNENFHLAVPEL